MRDIVKESFMKVHIDMKVILLGLYWLHVGIGYYLNILFFYIKLQLTYVVGGKVSQIFIV